MNRTIGDLAQLRALVDALITCTQQLRALHEQYRALQPEEASDERREKLLRLLHAEQDVLVKSLRIQEQIYVVLHTEHERALRSHEPLGAARPAETMLAPDLPE